MTHAAHRPPFRLTIPSVLRRTAATEVGLGHLVSAVTSRLRIPQCRPCAARAARLDRLLVFSMRRREQLLRTTPRAGGLAAASCPPPLRRTVTACPLGGIVGLWCRDYCGETTPLSWWYPCGICIGGDI